MFNLIQKRRWYFYFSAVLIGLGLVAMIYSTIAFGSPLKLSIDFTSGSSLEVAFDQAVELEDLRTAIDEAGYTDASVQEVSGSDASTFVIRMSQIDVAEKEALLSSFSERFGQAIDLRFESVGPTVGRETTRAAVMAILAASVAILFFVAFAFRKVPNAFRYGTCAIAKMFHDVIVLLGVASLLGIAAGWEADSLFLTAVVTVVGFSVQDVIVVFDRIRENIRRRRGETFETIVNRSLLETLHRSLATQLNAIFIMIAIIFFGGASIREFMTIMLIGMITGTYSSLFFAVPLLAAWEQHSLRRQAA